MPIGIGIMSKDSRTREAQLILEKAKNILPQEFAIAKAFISKAIMEINTVTDKKQSKQAQEQTLAQKWEQDLKLGLANPLTMGRTLENINKMIALEQEKLKRIEKAKQGDENLETILD